MNGDSGAGVVTAPPPTTAPHKERYFDRVDESNPEYQRERNMAPDLRQDFNMMEQKKRVSMILQSPAFCEELETMIQDQLKKGKTPTSLLALQQIADFMSTSMPSIYPAAPQGGMASLNMSLGMVTPVNDLRGSDSISYDKGEKMLRCKLAAFYRLTDLFGWSQLIYNHLTVRLNADQEQFLIVPFGLLYSEVTASSLVKLDLQGEIVDRGSTNLGVNKAGFVLHSAIYSSRPEVKCIVHVHTAAGAAVSAMKCGLLPISPEALSLGEVSYHDYQGILLDQEECALIQRNLGPQNKVLILRNHGLVAVGETVEEAFYYIHNLITACEIQVRTLASAGGPDNLVMLDPSKYKSRPRVPEVEGDGPSTQPKWQIGEQEFEAFMRMLDNLGYRTGYPYRCPALRDKTKKYSDVDLPSGHGGYSYGEDSDSGARSPLKHSFQRGQRDKTRWLNAAGRPDEPYDDGPDGSSPKSKPKWTKEDGVRQAAVANQFIPLNTNPKEVLEMRNKIREQNLQDIKTAGPQSQVLYSGSVVERTYIQGELVTASKAIIEKEYQPKVIVSKQGPNPFTKLTDQELEEYRREVELKQKGLEDGLGESADDVFAATEEEVRALESPQKEFHSAVLRALSREPVVVDAAEAVQATEQTEEPEDEAKELKVVSTPPSTPVRAEEESLPDQTFKDESDAATLRQTLPDLTPDDPSDATAPPAEDSATAAEDAAPDPAAEDAAPDPAAEDAAPDPAAEDSTPAPTDMAEGEELAEGEQEGDDSPSKSPSKKKKKFRTPSFLKKNKKKTEP
ncbi:alpha-adducin isoform X2 [Boleophthalmus pectinirostris]|uniref:alpha-adducin isoform X2 n=1 Tax=Boleophthalmus pectinirostris TaxID=150288 RepID=UPI00242C0F61|nr:alpha-adducin isoform X2 [Boleophthalmus pectinirostris]